MILHVNLSSRDVLTFDLITKDPKELLNKIKPDRLFSRPVHQFLGKYQSVSINPSSVEWIEVETTEFPEKNPLTGNVIIRQLSPETFQQRLSTAKGAIKAVMDENISTDMITAYGMATFRSGRSLAIEIQAKAVRGIDRVMMAQKIFSMPALLVRGEKGGLYIVNTASFVSWQVTPGLKKSTSLSLPGELANHQRHKS